VFPRYLWGADWRRYHTPVLRSMTVVGYMQSGKTTFVRYLAHLMHRELTGKGVDDGEIAYVEAPSLQAAQRQLQSMLDLDRVRYLMLFVDDAVKSAHSRRHNVEETKLFSDVRHWSMKRGVLITVYATQDFRLLDRLMRNAMVYAWKTLPFEWWVSTDPNARRQILAWIGDPDIADLLEAITQAIYSNDPEKSLAALQTAVVRIPVQRWGPRPVKGIQPRAPPPEVWYRVEGDNGGGEGERGDSDTIDPRPLLHALDRLLRYLAGLGFRLKWNRQNYLIVKTPAGRELSLGPLGEIREIREIVEAVRSNYRERA